MKEAEKWRWTDSPEAAVQAMERQHGALRVVVKDVKLLAAGSLYGMGVLDLRVEVDADGVARAFHERTPISWFKRWGIMKRWDSMKKADQFLQSDLGKRWLGYFLQECRPKLLNG